MSVKIDIFEIADQNSNYLKEQHQLLKKRSGSRDQIDTFHSFITMIKDNWTLIINMKERDLLGFLINKKYCNVYEMTKEIKAKVRKHTKKQVSTERGLEVALKGCYQSRKIFDGNFKNGTKFKYFGLYISGSGLKYGPFCVVIKRKNALKYTSLAFIKEDSLNYVKGKNVNIDRLRLDIANRDWVETLVALKHENDIISKPPDEWPSIICSDTTYVEAITTDEICVSDVYVVRIDRENLRRCIDYVIESLTSKISEFKKYRVSVLTGVLDLLNENKIAFQEVD